MADDQLFLQLGVEGIEDLKANLAQAVTVVQDTAGQMALAFQQAGESGTQAMRMPAEEAKESATWVNQAQEPWRRLAEATETYQAALKEVREAQDALTSGEGSHEANLDRMAGALENAARSHGQLAQAQRDMRESSNEASEGTNSLTEAFAQLAEAGGSRLGIPLGDIKEKIQQVAFAAESGVGAMLAVGAAAIAAGVAIYELGSRAAEQARELDSTAQRFQVTTGLYQLMGVEAERLAVDQATLSFGLRTLTTELARAKEMGGQQAQSMRDLGIYGQDTSTALQTLVNRLADTATAEETATQLTVSLGARGAMLAVVLKDLAAQQAATGQSIKDLTEEQTKNWVVLDQTSVKLEEQAYVAVVGLRESWKSLTNHLGTEFAPAAASIATLLDTLIIPIIKITIGVIEELIAPLKTVARAFLDLLIEGTQTFEGLAQAADDAIHGRLKDALADFKDMLAKNQGVSDEFMRATKEDWTALGDMFKNQPITPEINKPQDSFGYDKQNSSELKSELDARLATVKGGHDAELEETRKFYAEKIALQQQTLSKLQSDYEAKVAAMNDAVAMMNDPAMANERKHWQDIASIQAQGLDTLKKNMAAASADMFTLRHGMEQATKPLDTEKNALAEAQLENEKSISLQRIALTEQTAKEMRTANQISAAEETRILLDAEDQKLFDHREVPGRAEGPRSQGACRRGNESSRRRGEAGRRANQG